MSDATGAGSAAAQNSGPAGLVKAPTGIGGFDEITRGGLPRGRATLVTGGAGSGKTLFGLEFLVWGAQKFGEPGVLLSFEESADELATNVSSLGFDLPALQREGLLAVDALRIDRDALVAAGGFDLEGPVHQAGQGGGFDRCEAGGAGHHRGVVQRTGQRIDGPRGGEPAAAVAQGPRPDGGHHR